MKHILRKLHIGGSHDSFEGRNHDLGPRVLDGRTQLVRADSVAQAETTSPSTLTPDHRVSSGFSAWFTRHSLLPSTAPSPNNGRPRLDTTENAAERTAEARTPASFNFYEEEYQVQLALALSVSNQNVEDDPEALQIRAAKRISLGRPPSPGNTPAEITAHRYWNYNVLDYEEKVLDGFYDVYGGVSDFDTAGKLPSLVDLQSTPLTETLGCEVVLVNRAIDPDLVQIEQAALCIAVDFGVGGLSLQRSGIVQKIADLVVHHMGGRVVDANDMLKRWRTKSDELRASLNTIVLPLGCLQFGLSRHRALLFKVLADHVGIPCRLVKGSHYTGTDEGAVNIVKLDNQEYIVDLMGAPGTLLPGEIIEATGNFDVIESHSLLEEIFSQIDSNFQSAADSSRSQNLAGAGGDSVVSVKGGKEDSTSEWSHLTKGVLSSSANKHMPEHASEDSKEVSHALPVESSACRHGNLETGCLKDPRVNAPVVRGSNLLENESQDEISMKRFEGGPPNLLIEASSSAGDDSFYELGSHRHNALKKIMLGHHQHYMDCWTKHVNDKRDPVLENVAEWEIPWEHIVIGERIGLGSYGEVHHGDWHGKEVAVKRFLDQDFSGDALNEFISEVQIMRRMQHPNVVLFLGAVTRPPNLSIVTEYLPRGSLFRLLHRPNWQLDERQRVKMALDVAEGMNYLHTSMPIIVHRDLKSPNLLVDKNWVVKVCDFGLSRMKHHTFLSSKSTAGTPEWMAPEVLRNEPSNEKCDVYSFGVILWELATLQPPWNGMNPMQVVGAVGFQNRRLEIPKNVDPAVARIMRDCWQSDPSMRPPFSELTIALKPLQRLLRD